MIVDSSALLADLNGAGCSGLRDGRWPTPTPLRMSAANWVEAAIVVDRPRRPAARCRFDELLDGCGIEIVACHPSMHMLARDAWRASAKVATRRG